MALLPGLPRPQRYYATLRGAPASCRHFVDETRGARYFSKIDLASAYWQFRIREDDQFKTSFRVPGGQYEFKVGAFGLHGMSSLLMRYMHAIFGRPALTFHSSGRPLLGGRGSGAPEPML